MLATSQATRCLVVALVAGCAKSQVVEPASVVGATRSVVFEGMCDASGAVPISDHTFAVADDEDNVLRVYDADRGGPPLSSVDLSPDLALPEKRGRKRARKPPETDIEGATRLGDRAVWITSHGRNSKGKPRPERLRFFATDIPSDEKPIRLVGAPYAELLDDLIADARIARFELAHAATIAPKAPGGLNIEGLTSTPDGHLLIGFRNPTPGNRALVVPLLNPDEIFAGGRSRFGDPLLLDLGGLGVRSLSWWHGAYLIAAGPAYSSGPSRLFTWDGVGSPHPVVDLEFPSFNPEGFFTPENRDELLLLSDDGEVIVDGVRCKDAEVATQKRFRGAWVRLAERRPKDGLARSRRITP
jgi:hypothetical protein